MFQNCVARLSLLGKLLCNTKQNKLSIANTILIFVVFIFQTKKAMETGRAGRIQVEDIIFLIRKDPKKYSRVKELLLMSEELRKARKAFDEIKYATTK